MKKGAFEMEKIVAIVIIIIALIALIAFAKMNFDKIKEIILGLKVS